MAQLNLEPHVNGANATVTITGDVDVATAPELRALLDDLVARGCREIVLDCRGLEFIDSSGIGVLISARRQLGDDGDLVLDSAREQVRKVLNITGVADQVSLRP